MLQMSSKKNITKWRVKYSHLRLNYISMTRPAMKLPLCKKKLLSLMPKFYVYVNGLQIAEIVKEITFLKPRYYIIGKGWTVEGDLLAHDYSIMSNGNEIARIHKVWMSWGDSFELDIYDTEDEVGLIAVILAIDAIMDSGNSRAGYSST